MRGGSADDRGVDGGRRSRGEPDGILRPYVVAAVVVLALGVLCVLVELQSPSLILWTGLRVHGMNDGGIAYYRVGGQERTLDFRGEPPAQPRPVVVYADPDDASRDRLSGIAKGLDAAFVLVPFAAAGTVLAAGVRRRRRYHRRLAAGERGRRDRATADWLSGRGAAPPPSGSSRWRRSSR